MWHKVSLFILLAITSLLWIEVFTYAGFLARYFLPAKIILIIFFFAAFLYYSVYGNKNLVHLYRQAIVGSVLVFTLYLLGLTLDSLFGQGYFYELTRLRPESLFPATFGTLTLFSLAYLSKLKSRLPTWLTLPCVVALSFFFLRLAPIVTSQAGVNLRNVFSAPFASYDHKMGLEWGNFYTDMLMIESKTDTKAVIAVPADRARYPLHSNVELVHYFLYPRNIVIYPSERATHYLDLSSGVGVLKQAGERNL